MKRISFTKDALQDLKEIYEYIAKDNITAADKHRRQLQSRWQTLLDHPSIGRKRDEIRLGYRSVAEGDYVIFYRIASKDELAIMRIVHSKVILVKR